MSSQHSKDGVSPTEVLLQFVDAMEQWEHFARSLYKQIEAGRVDRDRGAAAVRAALEQIFVKFLAEPPSSSRFEEGRIQFGAHAPIYGRQREEILDATISESNAEIQTKRIGSPTLVLVYQLVRTESGWRIKDNRSRVECDGARVPWDL